MILFYTVHTNRGVRFCEGWLCKACILLYKQRYTPVCPHNKVLKYCTHTIKTKLPYDT